MLRSVLASLIKLSESRGKEAAGLALLNNAAIDIYKEANRGSVFMKKKTYKDLTQSMISNEQISRSYIGVMGHTRLVTNGSMEVHENNQPVIRGAVVGIHNGIIVNDSEIFDRYHLKRNSQVDTESLLALVELFSKSGNSLMDILSKSFEEIYGTASVALLFGDSPFVVLASNNGSLYYFRNDSGYFFASEKYILQQILKKYKKVFELGDTDINHVEPNSGLIIDLSSGNGLTFKFGDSLKNPAAIYRGGLNLEVNDIKSENSTPANIFRNNPAPELLDKYDQIYNVNSEKINNIKRCSKCILPETMPFIEFDESGACNYCRHYTSPVKHKEEELFEIAEKFRSKDKNPNCLFPLSGGRDSSYGLHYIKNILKMNPIAYSYDWGVLTDLGRRNQARMCGKLGVEHLLISADISRKRFNIKKNVIAWLKKPDLGTVPLFMAGDKQYFYYLNKLKKQLNVGLSIYSENPLEQTNFKFGFCGIPPKFDTEHVYNVGILKKLTLAFYYAKSFIINPGLINSSLLDTIGAYFSTYFIPHDYIFLYKYIPWDESKIKQVLIGEYDWEIAKDTSATWRIGDGTAPFYNYIYYTAAGFTENDTFRSNQIREGMTSREKALELAKDENRPRFDSIKWYCDTMGIDFKEALDAINKMAKLY